MWATPLPDRDSVEPADRPGSSLGLDVLGGDGRGSRVPVPALPLSSLAGMSLEEAEAALEVEREFEDVLSEDMVREVSGVADLTTLRSLDLHADTTEQSLSRLGDFCPNLRQLRLTESQVSSLRDLGTSFRNLRVLWLQRSGLCDLEGVSALDALEELYISYNSVRDVTPLALHDNLQVLDLEGNDVAETGQLEQLGTCFALTSLNLSACPVSAIANYRRVVCYHIPSLEVLDDEDVSEDDRRPLSDAELAASAAAGASAATVGGAAGSMDDAGDALLLPTDERLMVAAAIKYAQLEMAATADGSGRPHSARPLTARGTRRPLSARSPTRARVAVTPRTSRSRPSSAATWARRPASAALADGRLAKAAPGTMVAEWAMFAVGGSAAAAAAAVGDSSSDLTHGSDVVFAGNPVMAMRRRRRAAAAAAAAAAASDGDGAVGGKPADGKPADGSALPGSGRGGGHDDDGERRAAALESELERRGYLQMLAELKSWKLEEATAAAEAVAGSDAVSSSGRRGSRSGRPAGDATAALDAPRRVWRPARELEAEEAAAAEAAAEAAAAESAASDKDDVMLRPVVLSPSRRLRKLRSAELAVETAPSPLSMTSAGGGSEERPETTTSLSPTAATPSPPSKRASPRHRRRAAGSPSSRTSKAAAREAAGSPRKRKPAAAAGGEKTTPPTTPTRATRRRGSGGSSGSGSGGGSGRGVSSGLPLGPGIAMPDDVLVEMLSQKPKNVPQIATERAFKTFFAGINRDRMTRLLSAAGAHLSTEKREKKVSKRLALLEGLMV